MEALPNKNWQDVLGSTSNSKFRATTFAIIASMPSHRLYAQGNTMARKQMFQKRRSSMAQLNNNALDRRSSVDVTLMHRLENKGLKMDYDGDEGYDEMDRIKQVDVIRQMAVPFATKRKLREKVFSKMPEMEDKSCSAFCHRQAMKRYRQRVACRIAWGEFKSNLVLWSGPFKAIEGHFGSGVLSYFQFLKYLFLMNIGLCFIMTLFVVVPMALFPATDYNDVLTGNMTSKVELAANCSLEYTVNTTTVWYGYLISFLEGSGFLEKTVLFYGHYSDKELDVSFTNYNYNMPFAYITCVNVVYVVSLAVMVTLSAKGFRERLFSSEERFKQYFNKIFTSWDYSLNDESSTIIEHKTIYRDLQGCIDHERDHARRKGRGCIATCRIWSIRIILNIVVLGVLACSGYLIYYTTVQTMEITNSAAWNSYHITLQFGVQYMTSVTITALNSIIPIVFKKIASFEDYSPAFSVNLTLARTVFLRLASLAVLLFSLYISVGCTPKDHCDVGTDECMPLRCWETYSGQELYKLVLMDFIVVCIMTFFVEFPRRLIVTKCSCKLSRIIGQQQFDISKNVRDLVYTQTLMWLGLLFCPLLPAITLVKNFLVFYMKMLTTLKNYAPCSKSYKASDSEHFFQILLLTNFSVCVIPIMYIMWHMTPSRGCGPFRVYDSMVDIVSHTVNTWPSILVDIVHFIASAGVIIAILIALCLAINYLVVSIGAYKGMITMLKEQLYLEGQDKQFLLARMNELADNKPDNKRKSRTILGSSVKSPLPDVEAPEQTCIPGTASPEW